MPTKHKALASADKQIINNSKATNCTHKSIVTKQDTQHRSVYADLTYSLASTEEGK